MRATIEAMAGAVASKKPADVKKIEKAEIVTIRRRRARRKLEKDDAAPLGQNLLVVISRCNTEIRAIEP